MPQEVTAVSAQVDRGVRPRAWVHESGHLMLAESTSADDAQLLHRGWTPLYDAPRWVPVDERLPEPGAAVLVVRGRAVMRAVHVPHMAFCEATHGYFEPDGAAYYDEATDETYWPEGWYEWNEHEDTHWRVDREPTHWMPLPEAPPLVGTGPNV